LSDEWIKNCEKLLAQMKDFSSKKDKDRLDLVQSLRFSLYVIHRSVLGWLNWVNNPDIMTTFEKDEIDKMNGQMTDFVKSFIKYDIKITTQGANKSIKSKTSKERTDEGRQQELFYV